MTTHFTFFESYYTAVENLDGGTKAEFYDTIFKYMFRGELPNEDTAPVVIAMFALVKPNLDNSKAKQRAGKAGGSKVKAEPKQNGSKGKAEPKQNGKCLQKLVSDKEKDKERERELDKEVDKKEVKEKNQLLLIQ